MSDDTLIHQFSQKRCERAFAALVDRHLQLVFATALRQVGDRQVAEEIAQNVFLALARKAGRLGGHPTVAGWLYQAALKEARLAIRSKLRRERREEVAIHAGTLHSAEDSQLNEIIPLLDDALAQLRESDRLAVILRYLEEKPWREVGALIGVSEDAAQKRVGRAVESLGQFFAKHGFKISATALATGMSGQASAAAPAALAGVVTQAAIAKTASATGVGILVAQFMNLTKTQTTIATLLVCAAPIAYEASALRENEGDRPALQAQLAGVRSDLENERSLNQSLENELASLDQTMAMLRTPLAVPPVAEPPTTAVTETPRPAGWREDLPYVELTKDLLTQLEVNPVDAAGKLTEELVDVLSLTGDEIAATENVISVHLKKWQGIEAASGRYEFGYVPPTKRRSESLDMFTMRFPALPEQGAQIQRDLESGVRAALGDERSDLFFKYGQEWVQHMFAARGMNERLITISRTGDPAGTVEVQTRRFREGTDLGTTFHQIWTAPDDHAIANLHSLPAPLQIIAMRWHLNDRPR